MSDKVWRIKLALLVPIDLQPGENMEIVTRSRIPERHHTIVGDVCVVYGPWFGDIHVPVNRNSPSELAALIITRRGSDPEETLIGVSDLVEAIHDNLCFQFQEHIPILEAQVLDVTPPIAVGDMRSILVSPGMSGSLMPKYRASIWAGNITARLQPRLYTDFDVSDQTVKAALRWYTKGLSAKTDVERFVFYWVVIEMLCLHKGYRVKVVYTAPCGHDIPECPECKTPTEKHLTREAISKFLEDEFGLTKKQTKDLWQMRQMVHGQNKLDAKGVKGLSEQLTLLRYLAFHALKRALQVPDHILPQVTLEGVTTIGVPGFEADKPITEADLSLREMDLQMFVGQSP